MIRWRRYRPEAGHRRTLWCDLQRADHLRSAGGTVLLAHQRASAAPQTERAGNRGVQKTFPSRWRPHSRATQDQADRDLVPRRGQIGTEERPRADLGEDRDPATPTCRSAIRQRLPVRRHLPHGGQGRRPHAPRRQHPRPCRCISTRSAATSLQRPMALS